LKPANSAVVRIIAPPSKPIRPGFLFETTQVTLPSGQLPALFARNFPGRSRLERIMRGVRPSHETGVLQVHIREVF
jgi:hypothetical protein